jgi:hypothetical protein
MWIAPQTVSTSAVSTDGQNPDSWNDLQLQLLADTLNRFQVHQPRASSVCLYQVADCTYH